MYCNESMSVVRCVEKQHSQASYWWGLNLDKAIKCKPIKNISNDRVSAFPLNKHFLCTMPPKLEEQQNVDLNSPSPFPIEYEVDRINLSPKYESTKNNFPHESLPQDGNEPKYTGLTFLSHPYNLSSHGEKAKISLQGARVTANASNSVVVAY